MLAIRRGRRRDVSQRRRLNLFFWKRSIAGAISESGIFPQPSYQMTSPTFKSTLSMCSGFNINGRPSSFFFFFKANLRSFEKCCDYNRSWIWMKVLRELNSILWLRSSQSQTVGSTFNKYVHICVLPMDESKVFTRCLMCAGVKTEQRTKAQGFLRSTQSCKYN